MCGFPTLDYPVLKLTRPPYGLDWNGDGNFATENRAEKPTEVDSFTFVTKVLEDCVRFVAEQVATVEGCSNPLSKYNSGRREDSGEQL